MEFTQYNQDIINDFYRKNEASDLLTSWYNELEKKTLPNLRKMAQAAGYAIPILAFDDLTGKVIIKKSALMLYLADIQDTIITAESMRNLGEMGFSYLQEIYNRDYRVYAAPGSALVAACPDFRGEFRTLYSWTTRGKICECGNHFVGDGDEDECPICLASNTPMSYRARAEDHLGFTDNETRKSLNKEVPKHRLFGLELEYEGVTTKQTARFLSGHAIAKSDGTIRSGVEVVTRPASSETHKKMLSNFFAGVKTVSHSNTGMHIHVAKAGLGEYRTGFLLWFMNNPDNTDFLVKVAGRAFNLNSYCAPNREYGMTSLMGQGEDGLPNRQPTRKYSPFNTAKPQTYEFRIFRSPESHLEMAAKLDFVKALVEYSSPYVKVNAKSLKDKVKPEVFLQYIEANRKEYPDFVKFFSGVF